MEFKIHFTHNDGTEDSFFVSGESIEEIRSQADDYFNSRGLDKDKINCWSEEVE